MTIRPRWSRAAAIVALAAIAAASVLVVGGAAAPPSPSFVVPSVREAMTSDGELDEASWLRRAARTGPFLDPAGAAAIPFSEARLAWRGDRLHLALYAADIDIRQRDDDPSADSFDVRWRRDGRLYRLALAPNGGVRGTTCVATEWACTSAPAAWSPAVRVGKDVDGTPDDPGDDDEEWVLEVDLPLAAIGVAPRAGERFAMRIDRCDVPRGAARACGAWTGGRARDVVLGGP